MALTKCPECRGQVSDQASACPHCGYPLAGGTPRARAIVQIAVGLAVALVVGLGVLLQGRPGSGAPPILGILIIVFVVGLVAVVVTLRRRSV
jgi:hypothetical protein